MERPWFVKTWGEPSGQRGSALRAVLGVLACPGLHLPWRSSRSGSSPPPPPCRRRPSRRHPPHQGLTGVASRLDEAGVIRSPLGFMLLALARGTARSLKAGEYEIPQGSNTLAVLSQLEGGRVRQHAVLFREGSSSRRARPHPRSRAARPLGRRASGGARSGVPQDSTSRRRRSRAISTPTPISS